MLKIKTIIIGLILLSGNAIMAQQAVNSVNSGGSSGKTDAVSVTWSVGEVITHSSSNAGSGFENLLYVLEFGENEVLYSANQNLLNEIKVYPNKSSYEINVDVPAGISEISVQIYDLNGKLVYDAQHLADNLQKIDISTLINGLYVMRIYDVDSNSNKTFKIIKQ